MTKFDILLHLHEAVEAAIDWLTTWLLAHDNSNNNEQCLLQWPLKDFDQAAKQVRFRPDLNSDSVPSLIAPPLYEPCVYVRCCLCGCVSQVQNIYADYQRDLAVALARPAGAPALMTGLAPQSKSYGGRRPSLMHGCRFFQVDAVGR